MHIREHPHVHSYTDYMIHTQPSHILSIFRLFATTSNIYKRRRDMTFMEMKENLSLKKWKTERSSTRVEDAVRRGKKEKLSKIFPINKSNKKSRLYSGGSVPCNTTHIQYVQGKWKIFSKSSESEKCFLFTFCANGACMMYEINVSVSSLMMLLMLSLLYW